MVASCSQRNIHKHHLLWGGSGAYSCPSSALPVCPSLTRRAPQEALDHRPVCHPLAISESLMNTPLQVSGNQEVYVVMWPNGCSSEWHQAHGHQPANLTFLGGSPVCLSFLEKPVGSLLFSFNECLSAYTAEYCEHAVPVEARRGHLMVVSCRVASETPTQVLCRAGTLTAEPSLQHCKAWILKLDSFRDSETFFPDSH